LFIFVCDDGDLTGFGFADDSVVNVLKLSNYLQTFSLTCEIMEQYS
jgi:hypothetical protein